MAYATAHLNDIEEVTDGRARWRAVRHHFGIRSFGVNSWTGKSVGDRIINEHAETTDGDEDDEELYFFHSGRATFELDGERVDAPAGTFLFVPPPVTRAAVVAGNRTAFDACWNALNLENTEWWREWKRQW